MSYPPQGFGAPGYGPPGYGGGYQREHPQGTTILVLGILGLVACQLCGPFAWNMGNKALAEIDRNPAAYSNRSTVNAGRICGMIATILMIAVIVLYALLFVFVIAGSSTS